MSQPGPMQAAALLLRCQEVEVPSRVTALLNELEWLRRQVRQIEAGLADQAAKAKG